MRGCVDCNVRDSLRWMADPFSMPPGDDGDSVVTLRVCAVEGTVALVASVLVVCVDAPSAASCSASMLLALLNGGMCLLALKRPDTARAVADAWLVCSAVCCVLWDWLSLGTLDIWLLVLFHRTIGGLISARRSSRLAVHWLAVAWVCLRTAEDSFKWGLWDGAPGADRYKSMERPDVGAPEGLILLAVRAIAAAAAFTRGAPPAAVSTPVAESVRDQTRGTEIVVSHLGAGRLRDAKQYLDVISHKRSDDTFVALNKICMALSNSPGVRLSQGSEIPAPGLVDNGRKVGIAFTDVQSSTELWEEWPQAMYEALQIHDFLVRTTCDSVLGYEVKTIGDSFMLAFSSAVESVKFSLVVQEELLSQTWPAELADHRLCCRIFGENGAVLWSGLRIRIGIHCGPVRMERNPVTGRTDYFGSTVNTAARVEAAIKHGGFVGVTDAVMDELGAAGLQDIGNPIVIQLGEQLLKGVKEQVSMTVLIPPGLRDRRRILSGSPPQSPTSGRMAVRVSVVPRQSARQSNASASDLPVEEFDQDDARSFAESTDMEALQRRLSLSTVSSQSVTLPLERAKSSRTHVSARTRTTRRSVATSVPSRAGSSRARMNRCEGTVVWVRAELHKCEPVDQRMPALIACVDQAADASQGTVQTILSSCAVVTWSSSRCKDGMQAVHFLNAFHRLGRRVPPCHVGVASGTLETGHLHAGRRKVAAVVGTCVELAGSLAEAAEGTGDRVLAVGKVAHHCAAVDKAFRAQVWTCGDGPTAERVVAWSLSMGGPDGDDDSDDSDEPGADCAAAVRSLNRQYCRTRDDDVEPKDTEEGARILREFAENWAKKSGLGTMGPLNDEITLASVLRDSLYRESTAECEAMTRQLRADATPPPSDDEPVDTVVPHGCTFFAYYSSMPDLDYVTMLSLVNPSLRVKEGVWMFEVTLRRAAFEAFRVGWQCSTTQVIERASRNHDDDDDTEDLDTSEYCDDELCVGDTADKNVGWVLCTLGGKRAGNIQQAQTFSDLASNKTKPQPVDAGQEEKWRWREGCTLATCIDFNTREILYGMPGKGWFVAFKDFEAAGPVMPALAMVEALVEINLGHKPFQCEPPRPGCRPVRESCDPERKHRHEWLDLSNGYHCVTKEGFTMPARGLQTHAEQVEAAACRKRRRLAAKKYPSTPFEDGWVPPHSWGEMSEKQWSTPFDEDEMGDLEDTSYEGDDECFPVKDHPAVAVLLAASVSEQRPHGSEVLRYVRTMKTVMAAIPRDDPYERELRVLYGKRRAEGEEPLLPFRAYNVRTGVNKRKMKRKRSHGRLLQLKLNEPLWQQSVRPGDLILLQTRDAEYEEEE
eukprot:TRINITY_DN4417_c0_g2_i1.p1 TRINITY_DN4417_c0_g2~~TRINITY_DN4417_c0_g2_i1.p1  ORF type:complete len:1329 (+),score=344.82 TRINITY_DN4417_c0_g2_i1:163-4149(+)